MRTFRITVACALSALLAACGGANSPGGGSASQDPAGSSLSASGTITGVGSTLDVDGVAYDVGGATVTDDTDPANPAAATLADLQLGQRVDVEMDSSCHPSHIRIDASLVGLVDPGSLDTTAGTFTVLAQPVSYELAGDRATLFVGVKDASGLAAGEQVVIHGKLDAQGVIAARLVVVLPEAVPLIERVAGVVAHASIDPSIDPSVAPSTLAAAARATFKLGALTVDYTAAKVLPHVAKIADGQTVVVFSRQPTTGTPTVPVLKADTVLVRQDHPRTVVVRIGGPISKVTPVAGQALPDLTVDGVEVLTSTAKLASGTSAEALVVGALVRVDGTLAGRVLTATEIEVLPVPVRPVFLEGQVSSFVGVSSFVVRGTAVDASAATFVGGATAAQLADGVTVAILGHVKGSVVVADQISILQPPPKRTMTFTGVVSGYDPTAKNATFRVLGLEMKLDAAVTFTGGTAADFVNGARVQVTGSHDGFLFVVTEVKLLGHEPSPPIQLTGVASGVTADAFVLNNVTISVTSSTKVENGPLANGKKVFVLAQKTSGALVALEIRVVPGRDDPRPDPVCSDRAAPGVDHGPAQDKPAGGLCPIFVTGPVTEIVSATSFKLDGILVDAAKATFSPALTSVKDLKVGQVVMVGGNVTKGVIDATVVMIP
jgi:hypothetical protein